MISSSQSNNKEPSLAVEGPRAAGSTFFRQANEAVHGVIRSGKPRRWYINEPEDKKKIAGPRRSLME